MEESQVINLTVDKEEEVESLPSTSKTCGVSGSLIFFTILDILENLHILGMSSLSKWELVMTQLKNTGDIVGDPIMLQIFSCLKPFHKLFYTHMSSNQVSAKTFENLSFLEIEFDELLAIWQPEAQKKYYASKTFSPEHIKKFTDVVRKILLVNDESDDEDDRVPKRKELKQKKSDFKTKKPKLDYINILSENSSSGSDSDSEAGDSFAKLFNQSKSKSGLKISQIFQYNAGSCRKKITTPGEKGSHLIKIEITDFRDLKNCKSEKFYWQKINKKGYFLLNTTVSDDQEILSSLVNILAKVATRVSKIKNAKFETFETNDAKK